MSTTFLMLPPTLGSTSWRQEKKRESKQEKRQVRNFLALVLPHCFSHLPFFTHPTTESLEQAT